MMGRILILVLCFFSIGVLAQNPGSRSLSTSPTQPPDELLKHLTAAEAHQKSGDLPNAAIENRAVLGIALQRFGNSAIEEGKYSEAVKVLTESVKFKDGASERTNLAVAYLRQNLLDDALREVQVAISIDPNHIGANYILGNVLYRKESYDAALPVLEKVFAEAPDFEIGRALGFTYLNLKQIERAQKLFIKIESLVGKKRAGLHILFAKFYERTNYPADAERELLRAIAIDPKEPRAHFFLGYLLLQNGGSERLKEAVAAFEQELVFSPNDFYSNFFAGVAASGENDHQKAIKFLTKAIEINPESGEAHMFLAQSQIELDDLGNAEANLRRAIALESEGKKNTQARRTHFMLGRLLLKSGNREEGQKELKIAGQLQQESLDSSRSQLDRILGESADAGITSKVDVQIVTNVEVKLTPERTQQLSKVKAFLIDVIAQAFNNLGVIAIQNNQTPEALENFSKAFEWKPELPNLSRNLGIVRFRAGVFEKAIVPLEYHLKANPQDALIRKMLGSSYYLLKNFSKSVETLRPIEGDLPRDAELAYFYGISLIQIKQNREAVSIFDSLAKKSKQDSAALFYAGQGFMMLGDYERAVLEFLQVLSLAPETPKANYFIGQSLLRLNRLADAEKSFSRELEISPADPISRYHLALTLIERKIETERAEKLLEEALSLRFGYADALYQLGKINLEKGETKKAIERLEEAVSADADKDYIHYQLSIAYRKVSRNQDADRELKLYQKLKNEKRKMDSPIPMGGDEN